MAATGIASGFATRNDFETVLEPRLVFILRIANQHLRPRHREVDKGQEGA